MLIAPLDWGLGHTTRCIPVIRALIQFNCDIIVACNSWQKALLEEEFPQLIYTSLPGYRLRYGKTRLLTLLQLIFQVPKILTRIKQENRLIRRLVTRYRINAIISDNRFGVYYRGIPSIFITHQLYVKTGLGKWTERILQRWNYRYINRFTACWVPDYRGDAALAGELSNPVHLPDIPVTYIGSLSRFTPCNNAAANNNLLIILSGPEPQRTLLENKMLQDLKQHNGKTTLIRALPGHKVGLQVPENVTVYNHVPADVLNAMICAADMIISRSGYTTVMDIMKAGKNSILIPTPGQAEQEYLAQHLYEKKLVYTVSQNNFSLAEALTAAGEFSFQQKQYDMEVYKTVLKEFTERI